MGKIRTRILGVEEVEKKQKDKQKQRSLEKRTASAKATAVEEKGAVSVKTTTAKEKPKKMVVVHKRGKLYSEAKKKIDRTKKYALEEAVKILKGIRFAKFDESVELHINVDEAGLKGEVELPFTTGKSVRVALVSDQLLLDIEKGKFEFDVLITHPSFMPRLAKYAKVLGPKGLMPNPKAGTISDKPEEVAKRFSKGVLRWKTEVKSPIVHQMIGKISHEEKNIKENAKKLIQSIGKGHILSLFIKTTVSPSLKIDIEQI